MILSIRHRRIAFCLAAFVASAPPFPMMPQVRAQAPAATAPAATAPAATAQAATAQAATAQAATAQAAAEQMKTDFFAALAKPDVARATALLNANPKLATTVDKNNASPMSAVIQSGSVELARLLLDKGVDVNGGGRGGTSPPLMQAVQNSKKEGSRVVKPFQKG